MADAADPIYEQLLIARCQAGDESAFAELVERYQGRLQYFLRKILSSPLKIDDLLQDVWLDVFRALPKLREPAAFPAWVYRIARDRAYREMRRPPDATSFNNEIDEIASDDERADVFSEDDVRFVHECLDELSPPHREALVLRFLQNLSYEAIAEVVGCEVGTIRSRLHYAKQALRVAIERKRR